MLTFKTFLTERWLNLFTPEEKEKYVDEVWDILQASYAYAGGMKGNGFQSKETMINKIPFWKLHKIGGKIVTVAMYKDKDGRKKIAGGVLHNSKEGMLSYKESMLQDLERSYFEVSDRAFGFIKKHLGPNYLEKAIPVSIVKRKLIDDVIIPIDDYFYKRKIGGEWITKIMMGNPNASPIQR
jgi:hypothetical protein